jgi:UDP-glucose 6-dehydrogenase
MTVASDGFAGLQQMLNLGEIGIRIALIDQRVQKLRGLPYALLPLVERKILLLLPEYEVEGL